MSLRLGWIMGSGTYALRGREQDQIAMLLSALRHAKENGMDWKRIYSAVYSVFASSRPLLPSVDEMELQLNSSLRQRFQDDHS